MPSLALGADFLAAFARLPAAQQRKIDSFITQFKQNSTAASLHLEPLRDVADPQVRTARVGLDYRAVLLQPKRGDAFVLLWVDHHDQAMDWARHKRFAVNPFTGALQVLDSEAVSAAQQALAERQRGQLAFEKALSDYALFETFSDEDLLRTGLPHLLLPTVRALRSSEELDAIQKFLPAEAYEALFWIANYGCSVDQALAEISTPSVEPVDPDDLVAALAHPDSRRRFVLVDSDDDLARMLEAPLEKWRIFLHPSQARLVTRRYSGPARVLGGAGTGKTVVAMHRARFLAREVFTAPTDRILVTTYTKNLAANIRQNLANLCGPEFTRIEVIHLHAWASHFLANQGIRLTIADPDDLTECWQVAIRSLPDTGLPEAFLRSEWEQVVQGQGITDRESYLCAARTGRGRTINRPQRAAIWEIFIRFQRELAAQGKVEWHDLIQEARVHLVRRRNGLPYRAVVVDETQDWQPEELRLLRQMVPPGENDLFLVGDAHQRIYGRPVAMSQCDINVRGRSSRLRINYRTTEEIRNLAVGLLTGQAIDDMDGSTDTQRDYVSLLHGEWPQVCNFASLDEETAFLIQEIRTLMATARPEHICVVARTNSQLLHEYIPALREAGIGYLLLKAETQEYEGTGVRLATMHRVKGLEYPYIFVAGVNDGLVPLVWPSEELDPVERQESELRERCLLHVACTRAREGLWITSYGAPSTFLLPS